MVTELVSITDVTLDHLAEGQQLSATVDGERIWYLLPSELELTRRPEAFLAPALFEAMVRGVPLHVEDESPLSHRLLQSLSDIQSILNSWNKDLKIVPIQAKTTEDYPVSDVVACCFSGGVDSSYTYSCNQDSITHLLLIQGFAAGRGEKDDWAQNIGARRKFSQAENKSLITVHTNVTKFLANRKLSLILAYGGVICGLGAGLGFKQLFVPASHTFRDLIPSGSHPMLDPLWSTEETRIVHHGVDATRTEKTEYISKNQRLLDQLQVCWYAGGKNCGECGKCMRTALALYLFKAKSKSLPAYIELKQLKPLGNIDTHEQLPYLSELIELADNMGEKAIAHRLHRYLQTYQFRRLTSDFIGGLVGDRGRKLVRRLRPKAWHNARGTTSSIEISNKH